MKPSGRLISARAVDHVVVGIKQPHSVSKRLGEDTGGGETSGPLPAKGKIIRIVQFSH